VADPEQLFDASFQLSFLAVALLAAFAVPLIERTSGPLAQGLSGLPDESRDVHLAPRVAQFRIEMRLAAQTLQLLIPRLGPSAAQHMVAIPARVTLYFYELILTSAVIQVGLALPMAIYFHRVSFSGLSANAFVVPLLTAVVPIGFLALFTNSTLLAQFAGWLLELSRMAVAWHARWEPDWRIPNPPVWLAIAFTLALVLAAIRFPRIWVRIVTGCAALVFLGILIAHPFRPTVEPGVLEITVIDVGQGDSLLIAFPDGKLMLVDGGGIPSFGRTVKTRLDIGEDVVAPYLWTRSIKHLDVVALTHAHEDHIGGLAAIVRDFNVKELWTGATPSYPSWDGLQQAASARGVAIRPMQRGAPFSFGGASIQVLAPLTDYVPGSAPKNNDSLVLRLTFGRHSVLLTGDMEKQIEQQLLAEGAIQHTDVLKVGHHGSKSSSTPAFLDALHPAFALISDGFENSYGHPHAQTIDNLAERRITTYRTDRQGLLTIRTDGRYLASWVAPAVSADGP
jgi:competence protein ComEC